jgi:5'(3')-deoxyribonucleotidase
MSKIIAVDCDLTIAQSDIAWWDWLCRMCNTGIDRDEVLRAHNGVLDYDLTWYFSPLISNLGIDGLGFWRGTNTYDHVSPVEGSIYYLEKLKELGFDIIVVSAIKGNHNKSKWQFLNKFFPFIDGYIATKEKHYVKCDYIIDDRNDVLNKMKDCIRIKMATPYTQKEAIACDSIKLDSWEEIYSFITWREAND